MSERDFVERLGDELAAAARRQTARRGKGWRRVLPRPLMRRARGRALVLIGAVALVGAGGTAGLLAARGEVGGPPSLTFARLTPDQIAAGVKPLTRPVVFARGRLAYDGRPWQLVGFQTTRGLCIEIDFPRQQRVGGCGTPLPRNERRIDWQAQFAIARGAHGLLLGAVDPAAATVRVLRDAGPARARRLRIMPARVVHVREPRLLAALGLRKPFALYLAEVGGGLEAMRAEARDAGGRLIGRVGVRYADGRRRARHPLPRRAPLPAGSAADRQSPRGLDAAPAEVRAQLAALRRPQRPDDLPPRALLDATLALNPTATVQVDAIRLLRRTPTGEGLYLVPTTTHPGRIAPPPSCLRTLAPGQRQSEVELKLRVRAEAERRLTLGVYEISSHSRGLTTAFDLHAFRHGWLMAGTLGHRMTGVVPDGVATVELHFHDGTRRTAVVRDNVWFSSPLPRVGLRVGIWRDAQGRVLRRLR